METVNQEATVRRLQPPSVTPTPTRTQPANEAAEQALLGALLVNNNAIDRVSDFLSADHFYFAGHSQIYTACIRLREQQRTADAVTLKTYLEQDGDLQAVGGAAYLADLQASVVSVLNVEDYARMVYDLFLRRQLIDLGEEIVNDAYRSDLDLEAVDQVHGAEEKLYSLASEGEFRKDFEPFADVLSRAIDNASQALNRDTHLTGATTGLVDLDRMLGGLQRSDLVILAARPSMGKTSLATNIAFNTGRAFLNSGGKEGAVVGFFSLEMSSEQLATRILSEESEVPSERIRKGDFPKKDFVRLVEASNLIHKVPMFIDDTAGLTVSALRTRAMRLKRQHQLGLIVVDYLQLMRTGGNSRQENRVQEISEITRGLKMIAKDLDMPVLALSQLSRQVEQREDKRPQLSDLRESGSIEQDADVVMFIYREAYYLNKAQPTEGTPEHAEWQADMGRVNNLAEVIIGKQRHGPTGTIKLHFEGAFTRFSNLEKLYHGDA